MLDVCLCIMSSFDVVVNFPGYQRELNYYREDGSFSAYGRSDEEGSMWLTAFVVKCFAQSRQFIFVHDAFISKSILWMKQKQLENGCFPSVGRVIHKVMQGGHGYSNDTMRTLTAFVLIAMLEAGVPNDVSKCCSLFKFVMC